jgi:hypothetical protein
MNSAEQQPLNAIDGEYMQSIEDHIIYELAQLVLRNASSQL